MFLFISGFDWFIFLLYYLFLVQIKFLQLQNPWPKELQVRNATNEIKSEIQKSVDSNELRGE